MCQQRQRDYSKCCVCVSSNKGYTVLGLSDAKETMRATLETIVLLLVGYFTLTNASSKLLRITQSTILLQEMGAKMLHFSPAATILSQHTESTICTVCKSIYTIQYIF